MEPNKGKRPTILRLAGVDFLRAWSVCSCCGRASESFVRADVIDALTTNDLGRARIHLRPCSSLETIHDMEEILLALKGGPT